jgi:adenine-specific DNA methylase
MSNLSDVVIIALLLTLRDCGRSRGCQLEVFTLVRVIIDINLDQQRQERARALMNAVLSRFGRKMDPVGSAHLS